MNLDGDGMFEYGGAIVSFIFEQISNSQKKAENLFK